MKKAEKPNTSRRRFLVSTATVLSGIAAAPSTLFSAPAYIRNLGKPNSLIKGVQIGTITYSFRSMPDQSAEATLKYIVDAGISAIELMGDPAESFAGKPESPVDRRAFYQLMRKGRQNELSEEEQGQLAEMRRELEDYNQQVAQWRTNVSFDKFEQLRSMYNKAGVKIYAFKPSTFGKNNTDAEIDYGLRAAKALGATHVTLEHPSDDEHTEKLGKWGARHKIYIGYHGHLQQTPTLWDTALFQSKFNALNLDIGHYVAAGNPDPAELIRSRQNRIMSMHLKDRTTPENGQKNLVWGEGDTPIASALQMMRDDLEYKFPGTVELEYDIPEGSDAVKEVANCLEFCRKALKSKS